MIRKKVEEHRSNAPNLTAWFENCCQTDDTITGRPRREKSGRKIFQGNTPSQLYWENYIDN